jgi:hypothetical protein
MLVLSDAVLGLIMIFQAKQKFVLGYSKFN